MADDPEVPKGSLIIATDTFKNAGVVDLKTRSWDGLSVWSNRYEPTDGALVHVPTAHRIALVRDPLRIEHRTYGPLRSSYMPAQSLAFHPADLPAEFRLEDGVSGVSIFQSPAIYRRAAMEFTKDPLADLCDLILPFDDPLIAQICLALAAEVEQHGMADTLLVESFNQALAVKMLRRYTAGIEHSVSEGACPAFRMQRVIAYIEAHLERGVRLADLAEVACLSPHHFSRTFKRIMGTSLPAYVMQRRIERAKHLINTTDAPLSQVALAVGFTGQSHFSTKFRTLVGLTPMQYRANRHKK